VLLGSRTGVRAFDVTLEGTEVEVAGAGGEPVPDWVLPVGAGLGYGDFVLDGQTLSALPAAIAAIRDPVARGAAWVALWENMLEGRLEPDRLLASLVTALPRETDELLVDRLLAYTRAAFWRFTEADERETLAPRLESTLRAGMSRARSTSARAAWFNTLRSVATTGTTLFWLERVWRGDERIGGLPLSEDDLSNLALDLAVRDVEEAAAILDAQLERITNPDRRERFAFVMPAASSDADVRQTFFEGLADVNNRRREAWVLEAARLLHHPLRAAASRPLVVPALQLVREIQQTGDIFFPKRWADATLGGYQSVQTAAEVRAFIDGLPGDYPERLRWVLLSSADPLFRAARLLN
jgi:aminopeptidase N